jgi:hypothetical protein
VTVGNGVRDTELPDHLHSSQLLPHLLLLNAKPSSCLTGMDVMSTIICDSIFKDIVHVLVTNRSVLFIRKDVPPQQLEDNVR